MLSLQGTPVWFLLRELRFMSHGGVKKKKNSPAPTMPRNLLPCPISSLMHICAMTPCDPMDYSLPGSSVQGIFQARTLEWVAISYLGHPPKPGSKPSSLLSPAPGKWSCLSTNVPINTNPSTPLTLHALGHMLPPPRSLLWLTQVSFSLVPWTWGLW